MSSAAAVSFGVDEPRINSFDFNEPQALANTVMCNEIWALWARGTGKTTGLIATWILHKIEAMPRSSGGMVGASFADIEEKILKPLLTAFSKFGLEDGVDYVYGKVPPTDWEKPYIPIIKYTHVLSFPNGTTMELISLTKKGSANSLSLQWLVGDEAKYLNEAQLQAEVFPILRGNAEYFGDSCWYGAKLFVTDKLSPNLHWILAKRKLVDKALIGAIIRLQLKANRVRSKLQQTESKPMAAKLMTQLNKLNKLLNEARKDCVYVSEARAQDNVKNLMPSYFTNMARSLTKYQYRVAIDNEDPTRVANEFYPERNEKHVYAATIDDDDVTQPLGIAFDWQASISPLVVAQVNDRVEIGRTTLNFLRSFHVKQPLGLKHVVDEFCEYYKHRDCKTVYFFYDHTAVGRRNMHKKYYEEVTEYLEDNGWSVTQIYMGLAPFQDSKYNLLNAHFRAEDKLPIRFNVEGCETLLMSMDQTATIEKEKGTGKDKRSERDPDFPQELSTHLGDTFDQLAWAVLELDLWPAAYSFVGRGVAMR